MSALNRRAQTRSLVNHSPQVLDSSKSGPSVSGRRSLQLSELIFLMALRSLSGVHVGPLNVSSSKGPRDLVAGVPRILGKQLTFFVSRTHHCPKLFRAACGLRVLPDSAWATWASVFSAVCFPKSPRIGDFRREKAAYLPGTETTWRLCGSTGVNLMYTHHTIRTNGRFCLAFFPRLSKARVCRVLCFFCISLFGITEWIVSQMCEPLKWCNGLAFLRSHSPTWRSARLSWRFLCGAIWGPRRRRHLIFSSAFGPRLRYPGLAFEFPLPEAGSDRKLTSRFEGNHGFFPAQSGFLNHFLTRFPCSALLSPFLGEGSPTK